MKLADNREQRFDALNIGTLIHKIMEVAVKFTVKNPDASDDEIEKVIRKTATDELSVLLRSPARKKLKHLLPKLQRKQRRLRRQKLPREQKNLKRQKLLRKKLL